MSGISSIQIQAPFSPISQDSPERNQLVKELAQWKRENPSENNAKEVARRILEAYDKDAKCLDLHYLDIDVLPPAIGRLTKLKYLNLDNNHLKVLPVQIGQLCRLKRLSLYDNLLVTLPREIGELTELERLNANANRLEGLPKELASLVKLEHLLLSGNPLVLLPPWIDKLCKLEWLHVVDCSLIYFPQAICNLGNLKNLALSENLIKSIPPEIGKLDQLEELLIDKNKVHALPAEIRGLKKLRKLVASDNPLSSLPPAIGELTQLGRLFIRDCQLQKLPRKIGDLGLLWELNVAGNYLKELPAELGNLQGLAHLDASRNLLKELPEELGRLVELQDLSVGENQLTCLPPQLGRLVALKQLNVPYNTDLGELPISLGCLPKLYSIYAPDSQIDPMIQKKILRYAVSKRLELWLFFAQASDLKTNTIHSVLEGLAEAERASLNSWLEYLELSGDFRKNQVALAKSVCTLLSKLQDPQFRELFFKKVNTQLQSKQKPAAMALNEVYTAWRLHNLNAEGTVRQKIALLASIAKARALRKVVARRIKKQGRKKEDGFKTYLYFESLLREKLELLAAVPSLSYELQTLRERVLIENWMTEVLGMEVLDKYQAILADMPALIQLYEIDEGNLCQKPNFAQAHQQLSEIETLLTDKSCSEQVIQESFQVLTDTIKSIQNEALDNAEVERQRRLDWLQQYL